MSNADRQYLELGQNILNNGVVRSDRTGTGTVSIFGTRMEFDIMREFPLLTTKRMGIKSIIHELLWFLAGDTNIKYLVDNNVHIWDEWANAEGDCGPIYGSQWRSWQTRDGQAIDQIAKVVHSLKHNPNSRRHIVSAWNVEHIDEMALPPCHALFQFYVGEATVAERIMFSGSAPKFRGTTEYGRSQQGDSAARAIISHELDQMAVPSKKLSCQLYQRSVDTCLGLPYNVASYALLTMMMAQQTDMIPDRFVWVGGDTHVYLNHVENFTEQLKRDLSIDAPTMTIAKAPSIFEYKIDDFTLTGYTPLPKIDYEISV